MTMNDHHGRTINTLDLWLAASWFYVSNIETVNNETTTQLLVSIELVSAWGKA